MINVGIVNRLATAATTVGQLDSIIQPARKAADLGQMQDLKDLERINRVRITVGNRQGPLDFEGRVAEALRVMEELLYFKNGRRLQAGYTRRSLEKNGPVETIKRIIAKKDLAGLRMLADRDRLDCAFEQIALDYPELFQDGKTLIVARETLDRQQAADASC